MSTVTGGGNALSGAADIGSLDGGGFTVQVRDGPDIALRRWPAVVMLASVVCAAGIWLWRGSAFEDLPVGAQTRPAVTKPSLRTGGDRNRVTQLVTVAAGNDMPQSARALMESRPADGPAAPGPEAPARPDLRSHQSRLYVKPVAPQLPDAGTDTPPRSAPAVGASPPTPRFVAANPAPPTDRWQAMRAAIAQCTGGFIERVICDQRTRLRYCDGYWGKVAGCPAGIPNDYGQ